MIDDNIFLWEDTPKAGKKCQVQLEFRKSIRGIVTFSIMMIKAEDNEPRVSKIFPNENLQLVSQTRI